MGPALHVWYCIALPKLQTIVFKQSSTKIVRVLGSVMMTQLIFSPLLIIGFFFANEFVKDPSTKSVKIGF
jgi:hypothetical protein